MQSEGITMLIAKRDYEPGDIIASEQPFIYILVSQNRGSLCDSCLQRSGSLRCSGCKFVYYCSKECQKKDWKAHHKYEECKVFKRIKDDQVVELFDRQMLSIRVYLTLRGRPELKDKKFDMPDGSLKSFNDTMTNEEEASLWCLSYSQKLSLDLNLKSFSRCSVVSARIPLFLG